MSDVQERLQNKYSDKAELFDVLYHLFEFIPDEIILREFPEIDADYDGA